MVLLADRMNVTSVYLSRAIYPDGMRSCELLFVFFFCTGNGKVYSVNPWRFSTSFGSVRFILFFCNPVMDSTNVCPAAQ